LFSLDGKVVRQVVVKILWRIEILELTTENIFFLFLRRVPLRPGLQHGKANAKFETQIFMQPVSAVVFLKSTF
jgi:hypothetical protein